MSLAIGVLVSILLAPVSPEAAKQAAKDVVESPGYQRSLPTRRVVVREVDPVPSLDPPSGAETVVKVLFWCGVGIGGALLLVALVRGWQGRSRDVTSKALPPLDLSPALDAPLADAEALAMAGKHAEAIHVLLLKTLRTLSAASSPPIPTSMTSREILARVALAAEAREALGALVEIVEVSHFGSVVPGEAEWKRSVAAFKAFLAAEARARAGVLAA